MEKMPQDAVDFVAIEILRVAVRALIASHPNPAALRLHWNDQVAQRYAAFSLIGAEDARADALAVFRTAQAAMESYFPK